ncbi:O-antigen ligase family protein [Desulfosporosinus meridiei]|uniref:Lipid A core-O-antigen ligase-like enyme n=1 Tax=Desulfosporosinus meridiei (strain ATCC BAA-275 / DSM 13257 / KCTC 12902 / NCIMB 13706 / S10) TaxID=768704 RepID=J7IWN6_DESMD|nr:O-antigen ligase family protein [Desulfosporosinus meridiei]AFQ46145.1 lipid A core-O-antigen ligase-like enyme [Desulfosporosinus meridiei DSM 13257]
MEKSKLSENRLLIILEVFVTLLWIYMVLRWIYYPSTLITLGYLWGIVWVAVKRPRWLPAVLIITFPIEVSKMFIPAYSLPERVATFNVSILDFFRLSQLAIGLRWLYDLWLSHKNNQAYIADKFKVWKRIKTDSLLWLPIVLLGVYLLSTAFSIAPAHSFAETVRLLSLIITLYLAIVYVQDEKDLQRLGYTLIAVGAVLGGVAILQYLTKWFFFPTSAVVVSNRPNTTFADPNIFARFLVVTFWFSVAEFERRTTWSSRVIPLIAILFQGAGLGITGSRGGILALGVSSLIFVLFIPRRKLTLSAMGVMILAIIAAALLNPSIMARIESLRAGLLNASGGIREYLWRSGIAMIRDHPVIGVGVGAFGVAFTTIYPYFNPYSTFYVSLSHTAVITVLAETGIVGFTVLYFLFGKTLQRGWGIARKLQDERLRFLSASIVAGIIAIFISAQGEGRLYEEPLLWLLWAMLVSISQLANLQIRKEHTKL